MDNIIVVAVAASSALPLPNYSRTKGKLTEPEEAENYHFSLCQFFLLACNCSAHWLTIFLQEKLVGWVHFSPTSVISKCQQATNRTGLSRKQRPLSLKSKSSAVPTICSALPPHYHVAHSSHAKTARNQGSWIQPSLGNHSSSALVCDMKDRSSILALPSRLCLTGATDELLTQPALHV